MEDPVWGARLLRAVRKAKAGKATGRTLDEYLTDVAKKA
jgi:hypothetical protein